MGTQRNAKPAAQAPVSAHPLFPAIVALWFAALLGIGTMVLPQALFDQVGVATGMGALGFTFRLALGLGAGLVGAIIGVLLARKVAAGQSASKARPRAKAPESTKGTAKKPISAMEELGSDGLDEPIATVASRPGTEPINGRRRALTVTDESEPSDYMMHVPLPGNDGVLDLMGAEDFEEEEALELGHFDQQREDDERMTGFTGHAAPAPAPATAGSPLFGSDPFGETDSDSLATPPPPAGPSASDGIFRPPQPAPYAAPFAPAAPFATPSPGVARAEQPAPVASPFAPPVAAEPFATGVSPHTAAAPFAPPIPTPQPAAAPVSAATFGGNAFSMPVPAPEDAAPAVPEAFAAPVASFAPPVAAPPVFEHAQPAQADQGPELAGLDTVALVERFTRALRHASSATGAPATSASALTGMTVPQAPFNPEPAPAPAFPVDPAPAAPFAMPSPAAAVQPAGTVGHPPAFMGQPTPDSSLPAALAPLSFDDGDDHDDADHGFSLPFARMDKPFASPSAPVAPDMPQPFAAPQPAAELPAEADSDHESGNEDSFGSLLAMKAGFAPSREFVRIEDEEPVDGAIEPVVVFPGTAQQGRAAPAPDGPTRDPAEAAPFARPPFAPPQAQRAGQATDPTATEAALRDALARLQQMSGAA